MLVEIEENIRTILKNVIMPSMDTESISSEDDLSKIGLNSINIIKLIVAIENHYHFDFELEDLTRENMGSISNLAKIVQKYIS